MDQAMYFNTASITAFDFSFENSADLYIHYEGTEDRKNKMVQDLFQSNLGDFPRLPGDPNRYDLRGNYRRFLIHANYSTQIKKQETNLISSLTYLKLRVIDVTKSYKLKENADIPENSKIFTVFSRHTHGNKVYALYHKLISDFKEVGGTSGNKHQSKFYFEIKNSGPVCESQIIESLDEDLGLDWAYVKVERGMWDDKVTFRMKTNLMSEECIFELLEPDYTWIDFGVVFFGNDYSAGGYKPDQQPVFYYDYKDIFEGNGGYFLGKDHQKSCGIEAEVVNGFFKGGMKVIECQSGKVRIFNECLDLNPLPGGCLHTGSECKKCRKGYARDSVTKSCQKCSENCLHCSIDYPNFQCIACSQNYEPLTDGTCRKCDEDTQIWDKLSKKCLPSVELNQLSPIIFQGKTFPNDTYVALELKFTVDDTGTYEQENIHVYIEGRGIIAVYNNITSSFYSNNEKFHIFYLNLGVIKEFGNVYLFTNWDEETPDESLTIDYVRVSNQLMDYENNICLLDDYSSQCTLCNKYKLYYKAWDGCKKNIDYYYTAQFLAGFYDYFIPCDPVNNSTKQCWGGEAPGRVQCTNDSFLLIEGDCLKCDENCWTCSGNGELNQTDNLGNCTSCFGEDEGLKFFEGNSSSICLKCKTGCLRCLNYDRCELCDEGFGFDFGVENKVSCKTCEEKCLKCSEYQTCQVCLDGFELDDQGKCLKICPEKETFSRGYECLNCHLNCNSCFEEGVDECLSCKTGSRKFFGNCSNKENGCCFQCLDNCSECSYDHICEACINDEYVLDENFSCSKSKIDDLEYVSIEDYYFLKKNGKIKIIFNSTISSESIQKHCEITKNFEAEGLTCQSTSEKTCEINLNINETNNIKNGVLTFKIPKTLKITEKTGKQFILLNNTIKINIDYYNNNKIDSLMETSGSGASKVAKGSFFLLLINKVGSFLQLLKLTQHIEFLLYLNIEMPSNLYYFLKYFNFSIFNHIENPLDKIGTQNCKLSHIFIDMEVSCLFVQNLSFELIGLFSLILLKLILKFLSFVYNFVYQKKIENKKNCLEIVDGWFGVRTFFLFFDVFSFEMSFFGFLQLKLRSFKNFYSAFNFGLGIMSLLGCLVLSIITLKFTSEYSKIMKDEKSLKKRKKHLIENILKNQNFDNFFGKYFLLIIQIKNIFYGFVVVYLENYPTVQILIHVVIKLIYLIFLMKNNPFNGMIEYLREVSLTIFLLPILVMMLFLSSQRLKLGDQEFNYKYLGFGTIVFFSLIFLSIIVFSWVEFFLKLREMWKKSKKGKKKISAKNVVGKGIRPSLDEEDKERREEKDNKKYSKKNILNDDEEKKRRKNSIWRKSKGKKVPMIDREMYNGNLPLPFPRLRTKIQSKIEVKIKGEKSSKMKLSSSTPINQIKEMGNQRKKYLRGKLSFKIDKGIDIKTIGKIRLNNYLDIRRRKSRREKKVEEVIRVNKEKMKLLKKKRGSGKF